MGNSCAKKELIHFGINQNGKLYDNEFDNGFYWSQFLKSLNNDNVKDFKVRLKQLTECEINPFYVRYIIWGERMNLAWITVAASAPRCLRFVLKQNQDLLNYTNRLGWNIFHWAAATSSEVESSYSKFIVLSNIISSENIRVTKSIAILDILLQYKMSPYIKVKKKWKFNGKYSEKNKNVMQIAFLYNRINFSKVLSKYLSSKRNYVPPSIPISSSGQVIQSSSSIQNLPIAPSAPCIQHLPIANGYRDFFASKQLVKC